MIRYAILYFVLLVLFVVLFIGPVIVRRFVTGLPEIPMNLQQPTGQDNNDTVASVTGSVLIPGLGNDGAAATGGGGGGGGGGGDSGSDSTADSGSDPFPSGVGLGGKLVRW